MKIALAQVNTTVGDFSGNLECVQRKVAEAKAAHADLIVFPELTLTGYPPRDLLEQTHFVRKNKEALEALVPESKDIGILIGFVTENTCVGEKPLHNAAALLVDCKIQNIFAKQLLPTYDVFDEGRYFAAAHESGHFTFKGQCFGVTICEDIWNDKTFWEAPRYSKDPVEELLDQGIDCLLNISASPYGWDKEERRDEMIQATARRHQIPILFCNLVGGNDELVFDGRSMAVDAKGEVVAQAAAFKEDILVIERSSGDGSCRLDIPLSGVGLKARSAKGMPRATRRPSSTETLFNALALGVRDYVRKCGFEKVVLGLSGGIDSSVTAAIATEALGGDCVLGLLMPSKYTSQESNEDALALAKNLNIKTETISIDPVVDSFNQALADLFEDRPADITEENLQARARGNLLMAVSNKLGHLVLSTGNKSELSVGYCTLYGDMSGGLAVLSDIPKTLVYQLARWINRESETIPKRILTKPPSAELKPNQKDEDTLPPYEVLDAILKAYIEEHEGRESIIQRGFKPETVDWVISRVMANEYKRRQMPVGIKVSKKAFGIGRRFPIARKH